MVNTNYYSMNSVPGPAIPSPKQRSGKRNMFRRISLGKSDSSSQPSIESLSEEFRDEEDEKNYKYNNRSSMNRITREGSPRRDGIDFDPFESIPAWGFSDNGENGRTKPIESPEEFEAFQIEPKTKRTTQSESSRSNSVRTTAKKLDQWSKSLSRKKNQFVYHSFVNEKRASRSKKNLKEKEVIPSFEKLEIEDRNDVEQTHNGPEDFPSLNDAPAMNEFFPPSVRDDSQGNLIGPLMPNTKLHLAVESPKSSGDVPEFDFEDDVEPPCENLVLESVFFKKQHVLPKDVVIKDSNNEEQESEKEDEIVYETSEYPSMTDYSSVYTGATENLPLLRAWGMKMVDCNNCGTSKAQKKIDAKKKKAETKKKIIEELWERKHFYWKYESVEDQRRQHLGQMDTLIFKIALELDDGRDQAQIEMPLGFQLSTITEGDEDVTNCCSPRSMLSKGLGSFQQDGKVTGYDSILDSKKGEEEREVDEVEGFPREPETNAHNNEVSKSAKKEKSRKSSSRRSKGRMRVLSVDEIIVPDDGSAGDSRGNISDITEDYLQIPFSSPLYKKVLKAFREAAEAQQKGNKETSEEMKEILQWV
eukprot:CAMPEP_0116143840 /NCGR_PEP_ID=MMETSP0329-20121206/15664_1 /TAXON_ID=697910 /ORGANISM="Pseudo-nitzschia arenysensis, Strain B593" /LENGTH=587 /DNA_ID=CAMNT_0003639185 /DNA_START=37 /DNA_END=1800 /DNA_ORIENTATION=-